MNFRKGLIKVLKAEGYRVVTAAPEDAYTLQLKTMVDRHISLPMQNSGTSLLAECVLFCRYLRLLREVKPDILLTYTIKPNIYGAFAARILGIPIINNVSGLGTAFIHNNWLTNVVKLLYRIAFSKSACVFFQNPEDRDLFVQMKLVRPEKAELLAGSGINLDDFKPVAHAPSSIIAFALIARLLWDKGVGEFVEAARIVKAKYPHAVFRLVGPKDVQNKTAIANEVIDQWVAEGVIEYLGKTDDVRALMATQDCVVLPSYREGMSRVLLEAAAMGKPLIASNVAGCKQVVDDGKNGFLCRVKDAQDLAANMTKFLECSPEQRVQMGHASRAKAEREFDEKLVFVAYLEKIKCLLA